MYVEQKGQLRALRAHERGCELLTGLVAAAAARAAVLAGQDLPFEGMTPRCGHWHAAAEPTRVFSVEHTSKHGSHFALPCQPQWRVRGRVTALLWSGNGVATAPRTCKSMCRLGELLCEYREGSAW